MMHNHGNGKIYLHIGAADWAFQSPSNGSKTRLDEEMLWVQSKEREEEGGGSLNYFFP